MPKSPPKESPPPAPRVTSLPARGARRENARSRVRAGLLLVLLGAFTSGCGFQLRGEPLRAAGTLPAVQLQLDRARTPLGTAVAGAMRDADIATAAEGTVPQWRVRVSDQQEERRSRTLTRGIQVAEYELSVALDFEVLDAAGNALHPTQRLSASRVYEREQENLLTNEAEEEVLWDELRRDVAAQLVAAVAVQLGTGVSPPPADAAPASGG
jgi:LPS-assembly lipoprotein